MSKTKRKYLALILVAVLTGCLITHNVTDLAKPINTVFQYSTINALMHGVYDGQITIEELRKKGDFGLGTFNALNGEMIVFNGQFFRANNSGDVVQVDEKELSPFATLTTFHADSVLTFSRSLTIPQLQAYLDSILPSTSLFYAIRVEASFDSVTTRSVSTQSKPYKPLTEVVKSQAINNFTQTEGTLIGFKMPDYAADLNVKGYHLHYLSANKMKGGHLLSARMKSGRIVICKIHQYTLQLPNNEDFLQLKQKSSEEAVNFVEKSKTN